jgi:hypothetical protein
LLLTAEEEEEEKEDGRGKGRLKGGDFDSEETEENATVKKSIRHSKQKCIKIKPEEKLKTINIKIK